MRIVIKGGVWKNTEDEVLKAAVMKYGKNQWARVASLLPRKTASQCKARWYEWLDPSIKKTEWTREEDEKLLHLAKLMPAQWRTIAPMVGRTASQCIERYERLLDEAQGREVDTKDDPRKLRPGEIDPHPESKPARPDPIDMDEDEKEMLAEARARLANTKGKKAKRKAREKQLEEARRLADLQKRRELKAAGLITGTRKRQRTKNDMIDYANEIPFEQSAPAGFYDTSKEDQEYEQKKEKADFEAIQLQDLEEEKRDEEEERKRKRDAQRMKKLSEQNLPESVDKVSKLNDPMNVRKRSKLQLPEPQVTDTELNEISKLNKHGNYEGSTDGSEVTSNLLGDYTSNITPAPQRMSRTPARQDTVMQEARNIVALNAGQTPLAGGENKPLEEGTGFTGVTPAQSSHKTPNALATSVRQAQQDSQTPMRQLEDNKSVSNQASQQGSMGQTPARDSLKINRNSGDEFASVRSTAMSREEISNRLAQLPEPQYEYDVVAPEPQIEAQDSTEEDVELDQEELDKQREEQRRKEAEAEFKRRSSALQRDPPLPRPLAIDETVVAPPVDSNRNSIDERARALIEEEMCAMLQHDNAKFPVKKKKAPKYVPSIEKFSDAELKEAKEILEQEIQSVKAEKEYPDDDDIKQKWEKLSQEIVYVPSLQRHEFLSSLSKKEKVEALETYFTGLQERVSKEDKKVCKLREKAEILLKGYRSRSSKLFEEAKKSFEEIGGRDIDLSCFGRLYQDENMGIDKRVKVAEEELRQEEERGKTLQYRYSKLTEELESLRNQGSAQYQTQ
eukprot:gb/GECG01007409.1/.p1 GENE.gb/GECG01007409.1/~~gb/GECG01007409.1/.p1  ORF type:complete len:791 (+),score=176.03 gb/GECG01007409.1/:1-2373(+)